MMSAGTNHEESWVLLPWLANGRLSPAERARVEEHLRGCPACAGELAQQRLVCRTLAAPDRVSYAPGPSFRKLMERIDGRAAPRRIDERRTVPVPRASSGLALWRPPGLAWAASVLAVIGLAAATTATYHWSQKPYATLTNTRATMSEPTVLHIALERSVPVGQVEELLRSAGARVVEGPDATGIFGVTPVGPAAPGAQDLRTLAQRLRADARVRWVQPLGAAEPRADAAQGSDARER
jgi:anti-sigma factor RsiW